jgi:hypothetical protein
MCGRYRLTVNGFGCLITFPRSTLLDPRLITDIEQNADTAFVRLSVGFAI